jgi:hypothetical protein
VRSGGAVVARATFDQTRDGDQWHRIGSARLSRTGGATARVTNLAAGSAIADALLVQSAVRYDNGAATGSVELDPMDATMLRRTTTLIELVAAKGLSSPSTRAGVSACQPRTGRFGDRRLELVGPFRLEPDFEYSRFGERGDEGSPRRAAPLDPEAEATLVRRAR